MIRADFNWFYLLLIGFWIWSAMSNSKKKNQAAKKKFDDQKREAAIKGLNRRVENRPTPIIESIETKPRVAVTPEIFSDTSIGQVLAALESRISEVRSAEIVRTKDDIKVDYDQVAHYDDPYEYRHVGSYDDNMATTSHFKLGGGLHSSGEPKNAPIRVIDFDFNLKKKTKKKILETDPVSLRKYLIAGEIFGKPKALRK